VGNITWKKNIAHAVRIFRIVKKTIPTATLTVVGSSMQELILATGFGSLDGVRAVVRENPEDMAKRYGESPFFMSTSLYEGGRSLAILEAMSFGCVVFASPIPSSIEFVKDRHNGIIVPSLSAEEDAAIVVSCVRSPALCAEVGRNAFRFSARQSWERQVGRLEKVLCNRR
jgi:glycosyltransferase involved in cell wall biosynthesis